MKKCMMIFLSLVLVLGMATMAMATKIEYTLTNVGDLPGDTDRWQYTYTVTNNTLATALTDFWIDFDYGPVPLTTDPIIKSLVLEADVAAWDEYVFEPSSIGIGAAYEAIATGAGLAPGGVLGGFAVSFDWLGGGAPTGPQNFYIFDPDYNVLDDGMTQPPSGGPVVPAPAALILLGSGLTGLGLFGRKKMSA